MNIGSLLPGDHEAGNFFKTLTSLVQDLQSGRSSLKVHKEDEVTHITVVPTRKGE